jgi:hypothetical protein
VLVGKPLCVIVSPDSRFPFLVLSELYSSITCICLQNHNLIAHCAYFGEPSYVILSGAEVLEVIISEACGPVDLDW